MKGSSSTKRRLLSILMAIAMVISMVTPQMVYALGDTSDDVIEPVTTEKVQKDDPNKDLDEDPKSVKGEPSGGNRDSSYTPEQIHDLMENKADRLYGEDASSNGESPQIDVSISLDPTFAGNTNPMAGGYLKFNIIYNFNEIEYWGDSDDPNDPEPGVDPPLSFFDYYGFISSDEEVEPSKPNRLRIHLPAGLLLQDSGLGQFTAEPDDNDLTKDHYYTLNLPNRLAAEALNQSSTITVYIGNNGTATSCKTYNFPSDFVELYTAFEVLDKQDTSNYQRVGIYEQIVTDTVNPITTTSPDTWKAEKEFKTASYDEATKVATFEWDVKVGLLANGSIEVNENQYNRPGRDKVNSITLSDTFISKVTVNGVDVDAALQLKTLTIQKYGDNDVLGSPVGVGAGNATIIYGTNANTILEMNHDSVVVTNELVTPYPTTETPLYTKYHVIATFDVIDPDWIPQFPATAGNNFNVDNYATLTTDQVYNEIDSITTHDDGDTTILATPPAHLKITKMFTDYQNNTYNYDTSATSIKSTYGAIKFTISADDDFTVYQSNGSGGYTEVFTDSNSYELDSNVDYYLVPGITYTLQETLKGVQLNAMKQKDTDPASISKTPTKGENWLPTFNNEETVGKITISKYYDDNNHPLAGAEFTLYPDSSCTEGSEIAFGVTDTEGHLTLDRIPYGTYYLKETHAPTGYASDFEPQSVTISDTATNVPITAYNTKLSATLTLTKYVASAGDYELAPNGFGSFQIQRKYGNHDWEDISDIDASGIVDAGQIVYPLPSFIEENGNKYTVSYRIEETIPTGYYDPTPGSSLKAGDKVYSEVVQLVDETNHAADKSVTMYNRKTFTIKINKNFYKVTDDGTIGSGVSGSIDKTLTSDITLYKLVGSTLTEIGTETAGWSADGSVAVPATWTDLKYYETNASGALLDPLQPITYLVKEEDVAGFELDWSSLTKRTIAGVDYVELPINSNGENFTTQLMNYEQVVRVQINKRDFNDTTSFIEGAKITVYDKDGNIAQDAKTGALLQNVEITSSAADGGLRFFLEPGQKYTFEEVLVPEHTSLVGYQDQNPQNTLVDPDDFHYATTQSGTVKGEIDLTGLTQPLSAEITNKIYSASVYNQYDPLVKIKKVSSTSSTTTVSGAKFTAYTKNSAGKFVPYPNADNPYVIDANNSVATGKYFPIPSGETSFTVYFRETTTPAGYLSPDKYYTEYHNLDPAYEQGQIAGGDNTNYTFYPVTITNKSLNQENVVSATMKNIPNQATVKIVKYLDGNLSKSIAFPITITPGTVSGGVQAPYTTTYTGSDGSVTFTLPICDANGDEITYTISEELTGNFANTYYKFFDGQEFTLTYGQVTTTDGSGAELRVENKTSIKIWTQKVYRKAYEYGFEGWYSLVPGVTVGLFQHVVDASQGIDKWVLVTKDGLTNPMETTGDGIAAFDHVERGVEYALVELASPHDYMYPYMPAHDGVPGEYRIYPPQGENTTEIPNSDINLYNSLIISGTETANAYIPNPDPNGSPILKTEYQLADMVNSNHWVQFHITKWGDKPAGTWTPQDTPENPWTPDPDGDGDFEIDNAVFELWRIVMPEGETTVSYPQPGWTNPDYNTEPYQWVSLGSYSSGTMYTPDDERLAGQFMTDADQNINDHYVYLLVEKNPGPTGTQIIPDYKYTYWHVNSETTDFTVTVDGYNTREKYYSIDQINHDNIPNYVETEGQGGVVYLASVRLAKWRDFFDKENGVFTHEYEPLPGVEFELRLPGPSGTAANGQVISYLTVGLEGNGGAAKAQSGVFRLDFMEDGTYRLVDFENSQDGTLISYPVDAEPFTHTQELSNGQTVTMQGYRIKIFVVETYAPDGFSYEDEGYPMWLCFVNYLRGDGTSWVFNDAYYVLRPDTKPTEDDPDGFYYTLAENQEGIAYLVHHASTGAAYYAIDGLGDEQSPLRIVDYPMENAMVDVHKFGYQPNSDTKGKTEAQLQEYSDTQISRMRMYNVECYLQKKTAEGEWDYWNYNSNEFGTAEESVFPIGPDGMFRFPDGLKEGVYKIWEKDLKEWSTDYEMAYPDADHARIFTVNKATVHINLYNPKKAELKLIKQDMNGNVINVSGMSFKLGTLSPTGPDEDGWYTFSRIVSGTYKLTETVPGYTTEYLETYLESIEEGLSALVTAGMLIGYEYETIGTGDNQEIVVKKVSPEALLTTEGLRLILKNPKTTDVKLYKYVIGDTTKKIQNASFYIFYKPFDELTGTVDVAIPADAYTTTNETTIQTLFTGAGWTQLKNGNSNTWNTNANGLITLSGKAPGVFVFYETSAGSNYSKIKDTSGNNIIYTAVVTGGIPITVNFTSPKKAYVKNYGAGDDPMEVTTYYESTNGAAVQVNVPNRERVRITASKQILDYQLSSLNLDKEWSVTFNVWRDSQKRTQQGAITLTQSKTSDFIRGRASGVWGAGDPIRLELGVTYYFEEVDMTPEGQIVLNSILLNGTPLTDTDNDGLYEIKIETESDATITVKNDWLYGRIVFKKYDIDDPTKAPLAGAKFEKVVYVNADNQEVVIPGVAAVEDPNNPGYYIADIPLVSADPTVYRIYETEAPYGFVTNTNLCVSETLSQTANYKSTGIEIANSHGNWVTIEKFDNVHTLTSGLYPAADGSADFMIFEWNISSSEWVEVDTETVADGKVMFLTEPGHTYAVAESWYNPTSFSGLEGIFLVGSDGTLTELTKVPDNMNNTEYDLYSIGVSTGAVALKAYNYPNISPTIQKTDVGGYHGTTESDAVKAKTHYVIYWLEDGELTKDSTRAEVEAFLQAHKTDRELLSGTTEDEITTLPNGTVAAWTSSTISKRWDPSKTYLIVEDEISDKSGETYDTLRKDDPRVQWFVVTEVVDNPTTGNAPVYEFKNIYGNASVTLTKTALDGQPGDTDNDVRDGSVECLLDGARKMIFEIDPTITGKNQMLKSFVVTEKGLQFVTAEATTPGGEPTTIPNGYKFTSIVVGKGSHEIDENVLGIDSATISATVTFQDASGSDIEDADILLPDVSTDASTVAVRTIGDDDIPDDAVGFKISYFSTAVEEATDKTVTTTSTFDDVYSLGEQFRVEKTKVYVTVDKQTDGTFGNPVDEIIKVTNKSEADLVYPTWNNDGSRPEEPVSVNAKASADVLVEDYVLPKVSIEKTVTPTAVSFGDQEYCENTYSITIKNEASSATNFVNPIVMDILPTASNYVTDSASNSKNCAMTVNTVAGDPSVVYVKNDENNEDEPVSENEQAIMFYLTYDLTPGDSITITFTVRVKYTALLFVGSSLYNDAYLSSAKKGHYTTATENHPANPYGYSFTDVSEAYGDLLDVEAGQLHDRDGSDAPRREGAMTDALGDYATNKYVWIGDSAVQQVNDLTTIKLVKAVMGDRDENTVGYHSTGLGYATRTNHAAPGDQVGWVKWRLSIQNGFSTQPYIDNLEIGDVVPQIGDGRATKWNNILQPGFLFVLNDNVDVPETDYTVYYYIGTASITNDTLKNSIMPNGTYLTDTTNWVIDTEYLDGVADEQIPVKMAAVKAFVVKFAPSVHLVLNTNMILAYETEVQNIEDNEDFFDNYAFTNANNRFYFAAPLTGIHTVMGSNLVSVSIMDKPVEVQGDIWIDEDQDNRQGTHNHRDYSDYAIVQQLKNSISLSITDKREIGQTVQEDPSNVSPENFNETVLAESIRHFRFVDLGPAVEKEGAYPYMNGKLYVPYLKGSDPYNYVLSATLTDDTDNGDLMRIFQLSDVGPDHYKSEDPALYDTTNPGSGNDPISGFFDSNFLVPGSKNATANYETYPFYIMYSTVNDQSKDIGFRMIRKLEITKVAQDDQRIKLEGVKFKLYGPYEDTTIINDETGENYEPFTPAYGYTGDGLLTFSYDTATSTYTLDPEGTITELQTGEDGKLTVEGLNWWKEYKLVEQADEEGHPIPGYSIDGAKVVTTGSNTECVEVEGQNGVFVLKVPASGMTDGADTVTISNPRYAEIPLQVEKFVNTYTTDEYTFYYELRLTEIDPETSGLLEPNKTLLTQDPIGEQLELVVHESDPVNGVRKDTAAFPAVKVNGAGTYTFTITEIAPDPLPEGWVYDTPATKTATATVEWSETEEKLVVTSIVYSDPVTEGEGDEAQTYEKFTNTYTAEGQWTPTIKKELTGRPLKAGEFTFNWMDGEVLVATGTNDANGVVTFTTKVSDDAKYTVGEDGLVYVNYNLADLGDHEYTITEVEGSLAGIGYSDDEIEVTVTVSNAGGGVLSAEAVYDPENKTITNTFEATGEWAPTVFKTLNGRDYKEGETYTVKVKDADGNVLMTGTVTAGTNGVPKEFTFEPAKITYDQDDLDFTADPELGTNSFTYTIAEVVPSQNPENGVTFDETIYNATVTIKLHKNDDGTFSNVLDVDDGDLEAITFINDYYRQPTTDTPSVKKTISGEQTVKAMTFEFTLTATEVIANGAFEPATATTPIVAGDTWTKTITVPKGGTVGTVDFDEITYKELGTYKYTITETIYEEGNENYEDRIVYSQAVWEYTVEVTDNLDGTMTATGTYAKIKDDDGTDLSEEPEAGTVAEFINEYVPKPTEMPFEVKKILTGEPLYDAEYTIFRFTLEPLQQGVDGYTMPDVTSVEILGTAVEQGGGEAIAHFDDVTYTKAGTYIFKITEEKFYDPPETPNNGTNNITYDPSVWEVTVVVQDVPGYGLKVTSILYENKTYGGTNSEHAIFTNDYTPTETNYTPEVNKEMTQDYGPIVEPKTYSFTLVADSNYPGVTLKKEGNPVTALHAELTLVPGATSISEVFDGAIFFTKAGTYTFTVTEDIPEDDADKYTGVTYDGTEWTLTVVVTDHNGYLDVDAHPYTAGEDSDPNHAVFDNPYKPIPVPYTPEVDKIITVLYGPTVADKIFDFELIEVSQKDAAGNDMTGGYTIAKHDTNTDLPAYAQTDVDGDETQVVVLAGEVNGTEKFGEITFEKAGTYVFTAKEVKPADEADQEEGITYDTAEWTLTIVIVDNDGKLAVSSTNYASGNNTSTSEATFTNPYKPEPVKYTPDVEKIISIPFGPIVRDKIFDFELTLVSMNVEGDPALDAYTIAQHVANPDTAYEKTLDGDEAEVVVPAGQITATEKFGEITFEKAGTYVFNVTEVEPDVDPEEGIDYDDTVWTLTIVIVDTDNQLVITSAEITDGENSDDTTATFTNPYTPNPTYYTPKVTKVIDIPFGPIVRDKIFDFVMTEVSQVDAAGNTITGGYEIAGHVANEGTPYEKTFDGYNTEVVVPAGQITASEFFGQIKFLKAGTYVFQAHEIIPEDEADLEEGITYDEAVWTLTIVVVDTDNDLVVSSYSYAKPADEAAPTEPGTDAGETPEEPAEGEAPALVVYDHSEATFDNDGKVVKNVVETETGFEFTNPYKPEPTYYTPMVTKIIDIPYGPIVRDKIFDFVMTEVSQKDAAGNDMTGGYTIAEHVANAGTAYEATFDGYNTQVVVKAGEVTGFEFFGQIKFEKAGTYVFQAHEVKPADEADLEEGITYDETVWTLTIVVVDTDNELVIASWSYAAPAAAGSEDPGETPTDPAEPTEPGTDAGETLEEPAEDEEPTLVVYESSEATFDQQTGKVVDEVAETETGFEFTNPYKPEPTDYTPMVTKIIDIPFGPIVRDKIFDFVMTEVSQKDAAGNDMTGGYTIAEHVANEGTAYEATFDGDKTQVVVPAGQITASEKFGKITFEKAGTYVFEAREVKPDTDAEEGITYDETVWTLTIVVVDTDNELVIASWNYAAPADETEAPADDTAEPAEGEAVALEVRESSEATFDEETGKVVEKVAETETGFEYTNPYKPEPTQYKPKVVKIVEGEPTVKDKTFYFEIEEISQVDAAGDPMEDGYSMAEHTVGEETLPGDETQITVPAGAINTVFEEFFGEITFEKAGTYTFKITESEGDLPGITYDDSEWILQIVIVDTDNELEVASWTIYGPAAEGEGEGDGEGTEPTEGGETTDPTEGEGTGETTDPTEGEGTGETTDPTDDPTEPTDDPTEPTDDPTEPTDDPTEPTDPILETGLVVIEHSEAVFDEDTGKLVTPVEEAEFGAKFVNTYIPAPAYGHPEVKKTLSGQDPVEDTTFEFVLEAVSVVEDGSFIDGEDVAVVAKDTWTKTITVPAGEKVGTVAFDEFKYVKAGTYVYSITETDSGKTGWTYSAKIWTITVTVTDTDGQLEFDIDYKAEDISSTIAEFINDYIPVPVDWFAQVQKLVAPSEDEDSKPNEEEAAFHFEFKLISADPKEGCLLTDTLTAETILLPAAEESDVVAFDTITFFAAGTYVFEVRELDEGLKNFSYDTDPRTITVKVIDNKGYLKVESVAINGGDAEIDGTKITVKVVNAYVPDTGDNSSLVLWTVALAASIVALCAVVFVRRRREEA